MPITLRPAMLEDVPSILAIEERAATAAHWTSQQYKRLIHSGFVLLREEDGELCGFLAAKEVAGEWEIENIVVAAEFRRHGIADALLGAFLRHAEIQAAKAIWLEVRESNAAARGLYQKNGLRETGRRRQYYKDPSEDAILYAYHFGKHIEDIR